jgi:NAD(P)H-nitrite reductase large subunit
VAQGQSLEMIFTSEEEVLDVVEKAILLFKEQGAAGERFADTINRLGFENVQAQLLDDEILNRKEAILNA